MILIAENFNSSIPQVHQAMANHDSACLRSLAARLDGSPAHYLDVNAGTFPGEEAEQLVSLLQEIIPVCSKPLVLDSPDPSVVRRAAAWLKNAGWQAKPADDGLPGLLLNSITLEDARYHAMLDTALGYKAGLVALLMDQQGMPQGVAERLEIAGKMVSRLTEAGMDPGHIFLDPMVRPVATDDQAGLEALTVIRKLKESYPQTHVLVGLSNISFGLPARRYLNRAFLLQAMTAGLDSAILNPLDSELVALWQAALTLIGQDEFCLNYLGRFRP